MDERCEFRALAGGGTEQAGESPAVAILCAFVTRTLALYAALVQEDALLTQIVHSNGPCRWSTIAENIEGRSGKSCRLR